VASTADGTHAYTYDAENRISTVDAGSTATFTYDAEGRRASKNAYTYLYDLAGHAVAELNSGTWDRSEVYAAGRHLATYAGSTTYFPHVDWLGTERVRTNTAGNIVETCARLPFGDGQSCTGSDVSPLHFTSKQRDTESNLDYFGARYYSSGIGRFITPDWAVKPAAVPYAILPDPQTLNLYGYVRNNPLSHADVDGHCLEDACIIEGAITGVLMLSSYIASPAGQQTINNGAGAIQSIAGAISGLFHSESTATANPNRPGTLGKPDHQETARQEAERINGQREVPIPTPGGQKDGRRADVVGTNPETGQPEIVQVYRPTPAGNVPQREKDAAQDIQGATGIARRWFPFVRCLRRLLRNRVQINYRLEVTVLDRRRVNKGTCG
jgi:RHS repeat-associated protein